MRKPRHTLATLAVLSVFSLSALAQFDEFRSETDYNQAEQGAESDPMFDNGGAGAPGTATEPVISTPAPGAAPAPSAGIPGGGAAGSDQNFESNNPFGRQQEGSGTPFLNQGKDSKYVNLNPETGFGPEVITSFDFPEAEIMEITKHMQKLTGINLILDKDVKGKVSISAPSAITVGDAWKAYITALNMAGYTLVPSGAFYKIINARDIRYTPTSIYTGGYTPEIDNYVMKVVALKYVDVSEISRNFRPFMSRYGRIIDIKQTNTIIIADTGTNINRLMRLIKFLDVPGHEESLHIIAVQNSSAQEIAKLLDQLVFKGGASGGRMSRSQIRPSIMPTPGSPTGSADNISKIIAEPRTNTIIALANAAGAEQLKELVRKLDVKMVSSGSGKVHVYYLENGDAEELAKTLSALITGAVSTAGAGGAGTSAMGGSRLSGRTSGIEGEEAVFSEEVKVTADKQTNALVVTASSTDWLTLESVIKKLDIPRNQVLVEGLILETSMTKNKEFGVTFAGAYGDGAVDRGGFGGKSGNAELAKVMSGDIVSLAGLFAGVGLGSKRDLTTQVGNTKVTTEGVRPINALIKAIATTSDTNILATPQILATDNTEATFEVGETVPVATTNLGVAGQQNTVGYAPQKISLILKITPQINKVTRFVKLKIDQRIDDFNNARSVESPAGGVPTLTRSAITEIIVRDRDTIVMGGLLRDKQTEGVAKVPLLGDIPVLGWLFKQKTSTVDKTNLLFFLTPKILATYENTAANATLDVLKKYDENIKGVVEEDPHKRQNDALRAKLNRQNQGPLYDPKDVSQFNDEKVLVPPPSDIDTPDYQDIAQEAVKQDG